MTVSVIRPGLLTTVQDLGRRGYQQYGVSVGGAMDRFAARAANILVGNSDEAAVLEATLQGPTLKSDSDVLMAVCGGDLSPAIDGTPVPLWRPVAVRKGTTVAFSNARSGCRAYLAIAGGIDVPLVLNSRSTYLRAKLGGFEGRALQAGDSLPVGAPSARRLKSCTSCPPTARRHFLRHVGAPNRMRLPTPIIQRFRSLPGASSTGSRRIANNFSSTPPTRSPTNPIGWDIDSPASRLRSSSRERCSRVRFAPVRFKCRLMANPSCSWPIARRPGATRELRT